MEQTKTRKENEYKAFSRDLGYKLRTVRERFFDTVKAASIKVRISAATITRYESGVETPNLLYVHRLMDACGLKIEDLFLSTDEFVKKVWYTV